MSSEGENGKNQKLEGDEVKSEDEATKKTESDTKVEDSKPVEMKDKVLPDEGENDKGNKDEKKDDKDVKKVEKVAEKKVEDPSEEGAESEKDDENEKDGKENDEDDDDEKEEKPKKKAPKNATEDKDKEKDKDGKIEIPEGSGTELGEIPRIDASISRFKNDDLKLLHKLLFKSIGKTTQIKKNIRKFNGFDFYKDTDEYKKKLSAIEKFEVKQLKIVCEMLDLEKKGSREDMSERILSFLIAPKDSGKGAGGGRPKRTAAVKANNRGYSSHDDSYSSDEKHTPRARRNAGKRANLKDETSSESDEDFQPSDASEEERPSVKRKRGGRGKKKDDSEDEASDVGSPTASEDSDDGPKNKKKKIVNSNKGKGRPSGRGRGRKPAAATPVKKKTPAKRGRKPAHESSEDEGSASAHDEEGSSSEDEPLAKKTEKKSPQPPTDDEIKTYVKEILEGANLEEITMKTVCKQVYAHYPDFDLAHKKHYIKSTVKSLIST